MLFFFLLLLLFFFFFFSRSMCSPLQMRDGTGWTLRPLHP